MKLSILVDGEWREIGDCEVEEERKIDENTISIQPVSGNIRIDWGVAKAFLDAFYNAELKSAGRMN